MTGLSTRSSAAVTSDLANDVPVNSAIDVLTNLSTDISKSTLAELPTDLRALIAVDLGAESCRVSLLRWIEGCPVVTLVHRFANAPRMTGQGLQWDLAAIEAGIDEGLRKAADIASEGVRSIAVDGWAVDYVHLNVEGQAIGDPFCYRDERTVRAEADLHEKISTERMRTLTGVQLSRINTLYQLYCEPAERRSLPWLNLPEHILHRLGARRFAEVTNASHSQMLEMETRQWSEEIFRAAGIPLAQAPELVAPGTIVGKLQGELANLDVYKDTALIAPACHDTASAIAGIPACGRDWAYISSGTWSLVGTVLPAPTNGPQSQADNFTNLVAADGRTLFHKNVNGMWLIRQCLEHWEREGRLWNLAELIALAELVPAPDALLEVDDPDLLLAGEMPNRINRQLTARGLPVLDPAPGNAPAFASLVFHSLAARYGEVLRSIARETGKTLRRVYIVGGASRNAFLNRLTAQATGLEVVQASSESSTLGNFAVQLTALELVLTAKFAIDTENPWATALSASSMQDVGQPDKRGSVDKGGFRPPAGG